MLSELVLNVGHAAGLRAVRQLSVTCVEQLSAVHAALQTLECLLAPRLYVCGGWHPTDGLLGTVEYLDPVQGKWAQAGPMPTARWGCAAAVLKGQLYVVGGDGLCMKALDTVERFDPLKESWEPVKAMPTPRSRCTAAALAGCLYVIGGQASGHTVSADERYDPEADLWKEQPPMPTRRSGCAAATLDGRLYILGGHWGGQAMSTTERYDPESGWAQLQPMTKRRSHCTAAVLGRVVWAIGGLDARCVFQSDNAAVSDEQLTHNSVEGFDPEAGSWEMYPLLMSVKRWGCSAVASGRGIFVFGGYDGQTTTAESEVLLPYEGWQPLATMPTRRWGACAAVL